MAGAAEGTTGILVGGKAVTSGRRLSVRDPATGSTVRTISAADPGLVDGAVEAAAGALGPWSATAHGERAQALAAISREIERSAGELSVLLTREQGKPLAESRREVLNAAETFAYYASLPLGPTPVRDDARAEVTARMEHVGVAALVLPWNYPVAILSWKLAPCLLAGNTAVVKPAATTPLADGAVAAIADRFLPPGVVNVVSGGDDVGRALVRHSDVAMVSLTGGTGTGRRVAQEAGGSLKRVALELGGNDAAIVFPSVRPERVASRLLWCAMRNAGQVCVAIKRLYLHEDVAGAVLSLMADETRSIRQGHGLDPLTQMGPLNNRPQLEIIGALVDEARAEGGTVVCGGLRPRLPGLERGLFYAPTLVAGLEDRSRLVAEEHFGPVLAVLTFSDEDDAVRRANATGHGLGASVWDADTDHARAVAARLRAGTVWVNTHTGIDAAAPFGGMGTSGIGREHGRWGLEGYAQWKTLNVSREPV